MKYQVINKQLIKPELFKLFKLYLNSVLKYAARRIVFVGILSASLLNPVYAGTTIYNTIADGNWSDPLTWEGGNIPTSPLPKDTIVNLKHNISYDVAGNLDLSKGVLNVKSILDAGDHTIILTDKNGQLNVNGGLILLANGNVEATDGNINLSSGAIQLCNGSYTDTGATGLFGSGYVFSNAGNISAKKADNFSGKVDWCTLSGTDTNLPTAQNCAVAQPPGGCADMTHYLSMAPIPPSCSVQQLSNLQTFQSGAYIIDMGVEPQTYENGIKPYGLIYDLVVNQQIPVYWSINTSKTKDGIDFSYNGKNYKSSSFIIPQDYATAAAATIATWKAKGVVVDGPTSGGFTAPIYDVITSVPNSVLDTANGGIIENAFYTPAEIPTSAYKTGTPNDVQACDDIFVLPHADPQKDWDATTAGKFEDYIKNGGFLWAGCRAPSGVENSDNGGMGLHLLSATGLMDHGDHGNPSPDSGDPDDYTYLSCAAIDPPMQFLGRVDNALSGGSEQVYLPEGNWRETTTVALFDPDQADVVSGNASSTAGLIAYGRAEGKSGNGMVLYESSHDISKGSEAENVAAARVFGNFMLMAGIDNKIPVTKGKKGGLGTPDIGFPDTIVPGTANSFAVTAGTATSFKWTSNCGGSFSPDDSSDSVVFNAPATATSSCIIKVVVKDNCGRTNFLTNTFTPPPPAPTTDYDFGDAPDSYSTDIVAGNASGGNDLAGASHLIITNPDLYLGDIAPDGDGDGQASINADGDDSSTTDDEDGISSFPMLRNTDSSYTIPASSIKITNTSGSTATLFGFIDFNKDGDFNDPGENASASIGNIATQPGNDLVWNSLPSMTAGTTYARFRVSTNASLGPSGNSSDGEVEDYSLTIDDAGTCDALSGDINSSIGLDSQLRSNDKIFLTSTTITTGELEGHVKAYATNSKGAPQSSPAWDAASKMTSAKRSSRLYSTHANGSLVTLANLDADAFDYIGIPDHNTIVSYTIDPSHDSGSYLYGRKEGSFLGPISPGNSLALISDQFDTWTYLQDTGYRSFRSSLSNLEKRVLFTSDDGFLYSIKQSDGDLAWGWMPRGVVSKLHDPGVLLASQPMHGKIDVLDLKDASGSYASYIIGSYKSGLGQFVLKLDSSSASKTDLKSVVWEIDETSANPNAASSPGNGKRAYFSDSSGRVYAAYVINNNNGTSNLKIRSLTDSNTSHDILLNYNATSVPYVISDFASPNAPAPKTIYIGDENGNVYSASLLVSGSLDAAANITNALNGTAVASLDSSASTPVLFIGALSSHDGKYYLRAQSKDRLTVFNYQSSQWHKLWTSYVGGAGKWANTPPTYAADSNIASLPTAAQIDDEAVIVGEAIVLPVSTAPTGTNCYRNAYYYFYKLSNGQFPSNRFYYSDNTVISDPVSIGRGVPEKLVLSDFAGGKLLGFGISDQKSDGQTGINKALYIQDEMTTGIRSWRELRN